MADSRPTVVHVTPWFLPHLGGIERHVEAICTGLESFRFFIVTPRIPGTSAVERMSNNTMVVRFGPMRFPETSEQRPLRAGREWVGRIARLANLKRVTRDLDYDVLHVHRPPLIELAYLASKHRSLATLRAVARKVNAMKDRGRPGVFTDHGLFVQPTTASSLDLTWLMESILRSFDQVICVDRPGFRRAVSIRDRVSSRAKVHYVPQPLDTRQFHPSPFPGTADLVVGYTGRWERDGMFLLANLVRARIPRVRFIISGGATDHDLQTYGPAFRTGQVTLKPNRVSIQEVAALYRDMDVLVDFYRGDGSGRSVLEAMASGRPVLRIRANDTHPVVHGKTGIIVEPDIDAIVRTISELVKRKDALAELGEKARKAVEEEYSLDRVLPQIEGIYEAAMVA